MVDWIKNKNGDARVTDGVNTVKVGVVDASPPYIRTHADGKWTDNLLALPTY
jgi:exosome complex RNA-binding protein Rrp42 (RNase PH superfamily)